ncbi:hypothetical protein OSJ77_11925 [Phyllobacterium sp. 0TCS1.6C]|uniref:hypothetical protein n=1 Tax=unclassified Phyllobacterium TaxID=2638441 RepID=UPI00226451A8|nr:MULTISPECIES: hypothetical protein [unclassified Phyllobacterium]MCX8280903.1 hypothetical protein [Phyllobacterium sp. 0TCS1.6C]MCX8295769.1 hypothetical protein [Phyllobacterium sp. 0TCS1.6A]
MDTQNRSAAIAALCILFGFGLVAFFMPNLMLAIADWSPAAAGVFAGLFVLAFFFVFWLRARRQKRRER